MAYRIDTAEDLEAAFKRDGLFAIVNSSPDITEKFRKAHPDLAHWLEYYRQGTTELNNIEFNIKGRLERFMKRRRAKLKSLKKKPMKKDSLDAKKRI